MARNSLGKGRRNSVGNLERLMGAAPAEEVVQRKSLHQSRLSHRDRAVEIGVYGERSVARDDGR